MISLENLKILTPLQKLPKNVVDLGQLIVAEGFKNLPKVQKIAKSGHTAPNWTRPSVSNVNIEHTDSELGIRSRAAGLKG